MAQLARGLLDLSDELEPVTHVTQWRHEHVQIAVTRLERHRGAHEALPVMPGIGDPLLAQSVRTQAVGRRPRLPLGIAGGDVARTAARQSASGCERIRCVQRLA